MKIDRRHGIKALGIGLACAAFPVLTHAQSEWPAKHVRFIVPVAPGGSADMLARTRGERLGRVFGQTFVVDNIGGGGGIIATQTTARAAPDGYTLMLSYSATHSTNPAVRKLPYDTTADFTPIAMIGGTPNVLLVSQGVGAGNVQELIALLKAHPTKYSYGSAGQGTLTHLAMEQFKEATNTFLVHVPYRGGSPMMADLLGGQVHAAMASLSTALPHIRGKRVRALAVTTATRHAALPEVPTLEELGVQGFDNVQWYGIHGPAGMPAPLVQRLNEEINRQINAPELSERLTHDAINIMPMTPGQFGQYVETDMTRWMQLVKTRKLEMD